MNLIIIKEALEAAGYPVAYSHFTESQNNPLPSPPFITYLITGDDNFKADNKVYKKIPIIQVELYTDSKDELAEEKVEAVLNSLKLPYDSSETYIDSEKLFQKIYEVRVI